MIYRNVELFNVDEIRETIDNSGVLLSRFPSEVSDSLKSSGAIAARCCSGCEIRFVTSATVVWLTMEAVISDVTLEVFCGEYHYKNIELKAGKKTTIELQQYEMFSDISHDILVDNKCRYNQNVWRVYVSNPDSRVIFYEVAGLDGIVRPPMLSEYKALKWLAYGSSITCGFNSVCTTNSYIQHAARIIKADVMNKSMSGSCRCEKAVADYIKNSEWDILTLELGINMLSMKTKEFKKRVEYLINSVYELNKDKKIFIITPYMSFYSFGNDKDMLDKYTDYTRILTDIASAINSDNLILINGDEVLEDVSYLSADLIHPSTYGHIRMGENLAQILKKHI